MAWQRRGTAAVAWIALALAVIGIIVAWRAYNRTGGDILPDQGQAAREWEQFARESRLRIGRLEVNANLEEVRDRLSQEDYDGAVAQLLEARADLIEAYQGAGGQAGQQELQAFSGQFMQLEQQIRGRNRDAALRSLDALSAAINQRIREEGTADGG
jgi:hypothetical protein